MLVRLLSLFAFVLRRRPSCNVVHGLGELAAPYRCRERGRLVRLGRGERVRDVRDVGIVDRAKYLRGERDQSGRDQRRDRAVLQSSRRYRAPQRLLMREPGRT